MQELHHQPRNGRRRLTNLARRLIPPIGRHARALRRVAENASFTLATANSNADLLGFFGYLRRDADGSTFNRILTQLNALAGDINAANIVRGFITTDEYRQRFGPDGLFHTNTAPVANADSATTNSMTPVTIKVLAND